MKRYTVAVCGHVAAAQAASDGQTIKTRQLLDELVARYGENKVYVCDTEGWRRRPVRFLWQCIGAVRQSKSIIMLPAHGGLQVFAPLFAAMSFISKTKLYYDVIGGWLPEYTKKYSVVRASLRRFNHIFVETKHTKNALVAQGYKNVSVMPNAKNIAIEAKPKVYSHNNPLRAVLFSRVMKQKGIEDATRAIKNYNLQNDSTYTLDIYGAIDQSYREEFEALMKNAPAEIQYKGVADGMDSPSVLRQYDVLLFPTRYKTEGIPGTIIDAYSAGLPVIAAAWQGADEIIEHKKTGLLYEMQNKRAFESCLQTFADYSAKIKSKMSAHCLVAAQRYAPSTALQAIFAIIDEVDQFHVVHIVPSLGIGGAEKVAIDIVRDVDKKRYVASIVSLYDGEKNIYSAETLKNSQIHYLHKKPGLDLAVLWRMYKLLRKEKPDVIHTHLYVLPYVLLPTLLCRVPKRIHTVHSMAEYEVGKNLRWFMKLCYKYFNVTPVAISQTIKQTISKTYGIKSTYIPEVLNGIRIGDYEFRRPQKTRGVQFINVARLSNVKNHTLLIEAFALVIRTQPNAKLRIVGDGPCRQALEQQVKQLGLSKNVMLCGASQKVAAELKKSDVFVLASKYEGLPLSILEAMATGLPIVATNVGGVPDVVDDGKNGYVVASNAAAIAHAMVELAGNFERREAYGVAAYEKAKKYDVCRMVGGYEKLYRS